MNKVTSINLGGQSYQLEEAGFGLLQAYLQEAAAKLSSDPDKDEIIADLEQAVAERLGRLLSPKKNVVTAAEIESIIKEMGPVESGSGPAEPGNSGTPAEASKEAKSTKRLYRIREGKVIAGICTGIAAYFDVDVVWVRIIFVLLGFLTHGVALVAYIVLIFVIPTAESSAQLAAAHGEAETAQELVKRLREEFKEFADKSEWKKWKYEMKHKLRQQRREWKAQEYQPRRRGLLSLAILIFILFWLTGLLSIIRHGIIFGLALPASFPLPIAIIAWVFFMIFIIKLLSSIGSDCRRCRPVSGGLFSTLFLVFIGWAIWQLVPESHHYFRQGYELLQQGFEAIKNG